MNVCLNCVVRCPSRTLQQDEEEQAMHSLPDNKPPVIVLNQRLLAQLFGGAVSSSLLVVSTSKEACALLLSGFPEKQLLGSVSLPSRPLTDLGITPSLRDQTTHLYHVSPAAFQQPISAATTSPATASSSSGLLLLVCQQSVPREESVTWARSVMGALHADHVLVLGCIPAAGYIGPGDPSQEPQVHLVSTSTAQTTAKPASTKLLPTGNVVGGLPAALMSHCQVRGISASLLVTVDSASNGCSPHTLHALAAEAASWAASMQAPLSSSQAFGMLHSALVSGSGLKAAGNQLANLECGTPLSAAAVVFM